MRVSGLRSTGPNFAKSTFGHGSSASPAPPRRRWPARPRRFASARLTKPCTSSRVMRPLRTAAAQAPSVDAEFAREAPDRRARVNDSPLPACPFASGGRRRRRCGGAQPDGAGAARARRRRCAGAGRCRRVQRSRRWRVRRLAKLCRRRCTLTSRMLPALVAGTSIVAFSLSSSTSGASFSIVSPVLTSTVITGTSVKSPMSGTRSSVVVAARGCRRCRATRCAAARYGSVQLLLPLRDAQRRRRSRR